MAIRAALGASRLRISRQILVESLLLSAVGALLGVLLAAWSLDAIRAAMPAEIERFLPGWRQFGINRTVLFWTALTAVAAGVLSAVAPVFWLNRMALAGSLHESGRSSTGGVLRQRLRSSLVVFETALSLVLLIGACLMVRSFDAIGSLDAAIDPRHALTFRLSLPEARYPGSAAAARFQADLLANLQRLPGVQDAAFVSNLPASGSSNASFVTVEGRPAERGPGSISQAQSVSPSYFHTLGLRLLDGRFLTPSDSSEAPQVAVVSQAFARHFYPSSSPLGRRVQLGDGNWITIVGVAADLLHDYSDRAPLPVLYRPSAQFTWNTFDAIVTTSGDPAALAPAVRRAVRSVDPAQPLYLVRSYHKLIRDNAFGIGYVAANLAALGAVALFLSTIGVYSVMAFIVGERTREFGVRLALGARRSDLLWLVLRKGLVIAFVSLALGLPAAWAVVRLLRGLLYGVSPYDLTAFLGVPLALAATLAAASLLPAARASRTDPLTALRNE
jgi:putative ABC transport system permease protein